MLVIAGIVGVIQYQHSVNKSPGASKKDVGTGPNGASAQPAPGSDYELVAAVSGIRAQVGTVRNHHCTTAAHC